MRLFTALDISSETRAALVALLEQLRPVAPFRWSTPANLHITTKFIGEWPDAKLDALRAALARIPRPGAIEVSVRGLGWFPNPHSPRVLFAGIDFGPALPALHRATDSACAALGIPAETKEFHPHLTLARIRSADGLVEVRRRIAQLASDRFGAFAASSFHLYRSETGHPQPGNNFGSVYEKLEEFPLL